MIALASVKIVNNFVYIFAAFLNNQIILYTIFIDREEKKIEERRRNVKITYVERFLFF